MGLKDIGKIKSYLTDRIEKLKNTRHKIVYVYPVLVSDYIAKKKDVEETLRRFFAKSIIKELFLQNFDDIISSLVNNAKRRLEFKEKLIDMLEKGAAREDNKLPEDLKLAIQSLPFLTTAVQISQGDIEDINSYIKKVLDALEKVIKSDPYYKEYLVEAGIYIYYNVIVPVLVGTKKFQAPDDGIAIVLLVALLINKPVFDLQSLEIIEDVLHRGFLLELQEWLKENDFDIEKIEEEVLKKYLEDRNYKYPYLSDDSEIAKKYKVFLSDKIDNTIKQFKLVISEHIHASLGNVGKDDEDFDTKSVILNNLFKAFVEYYSARGFVKDLYKDLGFKKDKLLNAIYKTVKILVDKGFVKNIEITGEPTKVFSIVNELTRMLNTIGELEYFILKEIVFEMKYNKSEFIEKLLADVLGNACNNSNRVIKESANIFGIEYRDAKKLATFLKYRFGHLGQTGIYDLPFADDEVASEHVFKAVRKFLLQVHSYFKGNDFQNAKLILSEIMKYAEISIANNKNEKKHIEKLIVDLMEKLLNDDKIDDSINLNLKELRNHIILYIRKIITSGDSNLLELIDIKKLLEKNGAILKNSEIEFSLKKICNGTDGRIRNQLIQYVEIYLKTFFAAIFLVIKGLIIAEYIIGVFRLLVLYALIYNISNVEDYLDFLPEDVKKTLDYIRELKLNYALIVDIRVLTYIANVMNPLLYKKLHECLEKKESGEEVDEYCNRMIEIYGEGAPEENPPELQPDILQTNIKYLVAHLNSVLKFCSLIAYDEKTRDVIYKMPFMKKPLKTKIEQIKEFIEEPIFDKFKK